ncbi:MAG: hypothetical protein CW341_03735 [Bacteroidetes bacterium]|nr:hypothetical protein [Bacteroidota bacterium]
MDKKQELDNLLTLIEMLRGVKFDILHGTITSIFPSPVYWEKLSSEVQNACEKAWETQKNTPKFFIAISKAIEVIDIEIEITRTELFISNIQ